MIEGARLFQTPENIGFELDLKPLIYEGIIRINQAIEDHAIGLLERAYEAGYDRGSDDEAQWARGVGPHENRPPDFEEFLANLLKELAA